MSLKAKSAPDDYPMADWQEGRSSPIPFGKVADGLAWFLLSPQKPKPRGFLPYTIQKSDAFEREARVHGIQDIPPQVCQLGAPLFVPVEIELVFRDGAETVDILSGIVFEIKVQAQPEE